MNHIAMEELTPLELDELKFCVESLEIYTEDEVKFIYNNLYRDENGLAHFYILGNNNKTLVPLYIN